MEILYLSVLVSNKVQKDAQAKNPNYCSFAAQKFNRLLAQGLVKNGHRVKALSVFFQPQKGLWWHYPSEVEDGVHIEYISSPYLSGLRHVWLALICFIKVLKFGLHKRKEKAIICDVLNISANLGALTAAKLIGLRSVGVVTDMPGLIVDGHNKKKQSFTTKVNLSYLQKYSHYVFLTEQMNPVINKNNRPYIILEGLVEENMGLEKIPVRKENAKVVLYAGGLHEKYGLRWLVEGFLKAGVKDSELWIYGTGPFVEDLKEYQKLNPNVSYKGVRPNDEIVDAECKATLLVNPRPTHEQFTQFSFPSKNMEYMVSGTPVLTTRLPGMPQEYYPYIYAFDEESINGYAEKIREVLEQPKETINSFGNKAREWVLNNKNNRIQAQRVIELLYC